MVWVASFSSLLNIQVSFAKEPYKRDDILQKRPIIKKTYDWLRLVGFLKLQVSFAKEPYTTDYDLQKRSIMLRSLLIVATPYGHPLPYVV